MPELPEVETIRTQLERFLIGETISKVEVKNRKIFTGDSKNVTNVKIKSVRRFAKVLSIDLSNNYSILIHVKLTGQLIYQGKKNKNKKISSKVIGGVPGNHTHVIFHLKNGILYYNDVRRFGWIKIVKTDELEDKNEFVKKLGPEPFKDLTEKYFTELLTNSRRNIKTLLMDQSKIGGIGNIYVNDALWLAKISPKRTANSLKTEEITTLYKAIFKVLRDGLKYGGASELAFVTPDGSEGEYQEHTLAYGREGKSCKRCKDKKIKKFFLSGRGTYWCPNCQK